MPAEAESVRVVVAEPAGSGDGLGTVAALRRLGRGVRIEIARDAESCLERARGADLVVLDRSLGDEGLRILEGLREKGPPALVVTAEATADAALETFQAGAADCVTAGADFAEVLPAVALEQIRAFRAVRERDHLRQRERQVLQTEKMASIGRLAAGVAHEINNPMGFVHANLFQMDEYLGDLRRLVEGAAALAERAAVEGGPGLREDAAALLAQAEQADLRFLLDDFGKAIRESLEGAERIRHIVQDLRAFAHRDDGEWVEADLNRCLDGTAHIVWTMMKHSVVLRKDYAALPPVRCRPLQLEQVFMNLLVNAYQAIEQRARDEGGTGEIVLRTRTDDRTVVVSIEDDGIGVPAEHAERIFDPFFTTKEVGVGTGLGLSTSFEIVRRHGGAIRALPRPGGGSVFEVVLPIAGPAAPAP
jgi:signal transduction histidine kinase